MLVSHMCFSHWSDFSTSSRNWHGLGTHWGFIERMCGLQTTSLRSGWVVVRNADSQAHHRPQESECLERGQNICILRLISPADFCWDWCANTPAIFSFSCCNMRILVPVLQSRLPASPQQYHIMNTPCITDECWHYIIHIYPVIHFDVM